MDFGDRDAAGMGADGDAGQEISQEQRLVEALGDEPPGQRGNQDDGKIGCESHKERAPRALVGNSTTGGTEERIEESGKSGVQHAARRS